MTSVCCWWCCYCELLYFVDTDKRLKLDVVISINFALYTRHTV